MNNVECSHVMYNVACFRVEVECADVMYNSECSRAMQNASAPLLRIMWVPALTVASRTVRLVMTKTKTAKIVIVQLACL